MKIFSFLHAKPLHTGTNRFLQYHNYLKENDPQLFGETVTLICDILMIPPLVYYQRLGKNESYTFNEKSAIASICKMPVHFLFPETERKKMPV